MAKRIHGHDLLLVGPLREGSNANSWLGVGEIGSEESQFDVLSSNGPPNPSKLSK